MIEIICGHLGPSTSELVKYSLVSDKHALEYYCYTRIGISPRMIIIAVHGTGARQSRGSRQDSFSQSSSTTADTEVEVIAQSKHILPPLMEVGINTRTGDRAELVSALIQLFIFSKKLDHTRTGVW